MKTFLLTLFYVCFAWYNASAQLEKIIVEKYYVTDSSDAADNSEPLSGGIAIGTTTYRVFVDLAPGSKLKKIFGSANHPFKIASDSVFFNHLTSPQSFAKEFAKNDYQDNTVGLDSWLTLGQTSKNASNMKFYGVPKNQDDDGNYFAGEYNNHNLLNNADPTCGFPLTEKDGIDTMNFSPNNWQNFGVLDFTNGLDSTIFGSIASKKEFLSTTFFLSNSGVSGVIPDSNQILIAQLTTRGSLNFKINLEIEQLINGLPTLVKYVAKDTLLVAGEIFSPFLSYPPQCGCTNPDFLEYSSTFSCFLEGSCQTPVKIGCMDTLACNYDPAVNINIEELCCYPGFCAGRNIEEVCPSLMGNDFDVNLYPNPTSGDITMNLISGNACNWNYEVYNTYGSVKLSGSFTTTESELNVVLPLDLSNIDLGMYRLKVSNGDLSKHKLFIKL